jgi:hypothetical protein
MRRAEKPGRWLSTKIPSGLRVKVPAEDGTVVMEMTDPAVPENGLQAFGDWVLAALEQRADGSTKAAGRMDAALRERSWRATTCWPISLRRGWEAVWYGISALFRWIWTRWPASSTSPGIRRRDSGS